MHFHNREIDSEKLSFENTKKNIQDRIAQIKEFLTNNNNINTIHDSEVEKIQINKCNTLKASNTLNKLSLKMDNIKINASNTNNTNNTIITSENNCEISNKVKNFKKNPTKFLTCSAENNNNNQKCSKQKLYIGSNPDSYTSFSNITNSQEISNTIESHELNPVRLY